MVGRRRRALVFVSPYADLKTRYRFRARYRGTADLQKPQSAPASDERASQ